MHTCTLYIRMPMWGYSWDIESASNMLVRVCPRIGYTTQNGNSDSLMRRMIIIRWMEWGTHFVAKPTCLTLFFFQQLLLVRKQCDFVGFMVSLSVTLWAGDSYSSDQWNCLRPRMLSGWSLSLSLFASGRSSHRFPSLLVP